MEMSDDSTEATSQQNHREAVVAMFRTLQAKCGVTSSSSASGAAGVTSEHANYPFRTFGYNALPAHRSEEGLVCLLINKNIKEIKKLVPTFTELLHKNVIKLDKLSIAVDSMNDLGRDQTQMIVYVLERTPVGGERRWKSRELKGAFEVPDSRAALSNLGVVDLAEVVEPDKRQIEQYLANPPPGVDAKSWEMAKSDNPDPSRLVPIQFVGFESLDRRLESQFDFQERQRAKLASMIEEINRLEKRHDLAKIRLDQFTINQRHIAHRILRVMGVHERYRLSGTEKKPYETAIENALLDLLEEIDTLSKGRLHEIQEMVEKSANQSARSSEVPDINLRDHPHVRELFEEHQKGFSALVDILNDDLKTADKIRQDIRGMIGGKESQ